MDSGVHFSAQNANESNGVLDGRSSSSGGVVDYSTYAHGNSVSVASHQGAQSSGTSYQYPTSSTAVPGHISSPGFMDVVDPLTKYK